MIYALKYNSMTDCEKALALSLQGVVNRYGRSVFIDVDKYADYLDGERLTYVTVYELVGLFADRFKGFVTYDLSFNDVSVNMAATVSAAYDVLGVPRPLKAVAERAGMIELYDLANIRGSNAERQKTVFNAVYPRLNRDGLVHQVVKKGNFHIRLRDLAIANRWACIYTSESGEDRAFRRYVLERLNNNIPVYGWNDDEIAFIKDISSYGDYALPTDWSCNHSFFRFDAVSLRQHRQESPVCADKHYVALVVSDGDNIQWLERDFSLPQGAFGQRKASPCKYKMTWTFSPSLSGINPKAAQHIYNQAESDYFISGVSGVGYANCLEYPAEHLDEFTKLTAEAMERSDLSVVCLLDNVANAQNSQFVKDRLHFYSRFDTIKGGIWELDPDRYGSGNGRIFFSDGKPFVSVRFTMWYPTGNKDDVNMEWLDDLARQVNAMPVDPASERGYSVVNVHPWTMSQDSVDYFVSRLDKDKIELVYADELLSLVKRNIKEK